MRYELINPNANNDNIISLVFENRNIKEKDIFDYIDCSKDFRSDPWLYKNMERATKLFLKHIKNKSKIGILVDCDCDGYMAATIMYNLLKEIDKEANVCFILHEEKKHGLYDKTIKVVNNMDIDLLIIPDAGSNQIEEAEKIFKSGKDVLIIDHHDSEYVENDVVVVNNQYNDINKDLSGAAMVLKFAEALLPEDKFEKHTDLAAISLISDNMAMNNLENRYYVKKGLSNINNEFIKAVADGKGEIDSNDVSFKISPIVNAIVRMGDLEDKEILMNALINENGTVELPTRKNGKKTKEYSYIEAAIKISKWRRDEQKELVNKEAEKVNIEHDCPMNIVMLDDDFNTNITGYFANVVSSKNLKPTIAVKYNVERDSYIGSARAANIHNFKDFLVSSKLFEDCEGHQGAFGVEIKKDKLDILKQWIRQTDLPTETTYKVDSEFTTENLELDDIAAINSLKNIWGKELEEPLFVIHLKDAAVRFMGANHNTFKIQKGRISFIKFNCSETEIEKFKQHKGNMMDIKILGTFDVNSYQGCKYHQIIVKDYEILEKNNEEVDKLFDDDESFDYLF